MFRCVHQILIFDIYFDSSISVSFCTLKCGPRTPCVTLHCSGYRYTAPCMHWVQLVRGEKSLLHFAVGMKMSSEFLGSGALR